MSIADVEAALAPYALYLALAVIVVVAVAEALGAYRRWGSTSRRSGTGKALVLLIFVALGGFLIAEGAVLWGALLIFVVLLVCVWVALTRTSSARRVAA